VVQVPHIRPHTHTHTHTHIYIDRPVGLAGPATTGGHIPPNIYDYHDREMGSPARQGFPGIVYIYKRERKEGRNIWLHMVIN